MINRGGRPKKQINQSQFEAMCSIQATEEEICLVLGVSDKTLNRWCKDTYRLGFSEVFRQKRAIGKISLRRAQFQLAQKSAAMAIWLGKQWLGQKDVIEPVDTVEHKQIIQVYIPDNGRDKNDY